MHDEPVGPSPQLPSTPPDLRDPAVARARRKAVAERARARSGAGGDTVLIRVGGMGMFVALLGYYAIGEEGVGMVPAGVVLIVLGLAFWAWMWVRVFRSVRAAPKVPGAGVRDELPLTRPELVAVIVVTGFVAGLIGAQFVREPHVVRGIVAAAFAIACGDALRRLLLARGRPTPRP